jgi:hypothetical protein
VSLPIAKGTSPAATAAAEPLEEPPGRRRGARESKGSSERAAPDRSPNGQGLPSVTARSRRYGFHMKVLEYAELDTSRVRTQYRRVRDAIERDDFRQAEVKKLAGAGRRPLYRAKLDDANRVLFTLLRHGSDRYALMLEVILQHAYEKSRFLRGVRIDDAKIPVLDTVAAVTDADCEPVRYVHPDRPSIHRS